MRDFDSFLNLALRSLKDSKSQRLWARVGGHMEMYPLAAGLTCLHTGFQAWIIEEIFLLLLLQKCLRDIWTVVAKATYDVLNLWKTSLSIDTWLSDIKIHDKYWEICYYFPFSSPGWPRESSLVDWLLVIWKGRKFQVTYFYQPAEPCWTPCLSHWHQTPRNSICKYSISILGTCVPKGIPYEEVSNVLIYIVFFFLSLNRKNCCVLQF